jgi:hypothetical protein
MTGFQSKRLMSDNRYADPVTIDHIIELRKEIAKLEMQLENTLAWVKKNVNQDLKRENIQLRQYLQKIENRCLDDDSWLAKSIDIEVMARAALMEGK